MNLILFNEQTPELLLEAEDPRSQHLRKVLRRRVGDFFDAGVVRGPRGRGRIAAERGGQLHLLFNWEKEPTQPCPVDLALGHPRPQSARRILRDAASMAVNSLSFILAERAEKSFADSSLWSTNEWERRLREGAEQGFHTWIPSVSHRRSTLDWLDSMRSPAQWKRCALDPYEPSCSLRDFIGSWEPGAVEGVILALGPERGWSNEERNLLRERGVPLCHLGPRILRSDTACAVAVGYLAAALGQWSDPNC